MKTKRFRIEISDEAEIDFDKSYRYYSDESQKVASSFYKQINLSFEILKQHPESFPIVYKNVRKFFVKKFPFVIYYQLVGSAIRVIAIFHTSRDPEIWNDRI
ncbi:MAG: type II toxin-antitoxin system RelE/ParE family toxin [Mangrovibacterium sp.]